MSSKLVPAVLLALLHIASNHATAGQTLPGTPGDPPGTSGDTPDTPEPRTSDWMADVYEANGLSGSVRLRDVVLPGTHNSATAEMARDSPYAERHDEDLRFSKSIVYQWSKNQDRTIHRQLVDGIRYLDIRVENHKTRGWVTYHGLLSVSLQDVLHDVARFAAAHPREVVIVHFQRMVHFGAADLAAVRQYMLDHATLGPRLASNRRGTRSTLQDFWDADTNVIVMMAGNGNSGRIWPLWISTPWPNVQRYADLREDLLHNIKDRNPEYGFYVSQMILTPNTNAVVTGFLTGVTSSKAFVARKVSSKVSGLMREVDRTARAAGRTLNIVMVDFYSGAGVVAAALDLNLQHAGLKRAPPEGGREAQGGDDPTRKVPRGLSPLALILTSIFARR